MNPPKKLTAQQKVDQQQELSSETHVQAQPETEFQTVEELLRYDALHTPAPPSIAQRLEESLEKHSPPARSWWRRLIGG